MAQVIAVANQKGGTGKTTVVANLAAALGQLGERTLVVDLDPQADATSAYGITVDPPEAPPSIDDVFAGRAELPDAIAVAASLGVDIVRGSHRLVEVEASLYQQKFRERFLIGALEGNLAGYEHVLIDCPPNLGNLTVNAFVAADATLVPVSMTDVNALKGLSQLRVTLAELERGNVHCPILGLLRTNVADQRRNTFLTLDDELTRLGLPVLQAQLGARSGFHDAATVGQPLVVRAPNHPQALAVRELAREVLAAQPVAA